MSRISSAAGPFSPTSPGPASHSEPLFLRSLITSSGCSILSLPFAEENRRDSRYRLEVVHPDLRVGNRGANRLLGVGDQLENPERVEQTPGEQLGVRRDDDAFRRDLLVQPAEHAGDELPLVLAHAAFSVEWPQFVAWRCMSIGSQNSREHGGSIPSSSSAAVVSNTFGSASCGMKYDSDVRIARSLGSPVWCTAISKRR